MNIDQRVTRLERVIAAMLAQHDEDKTAREVWIGPVPSTADNAAAQDTRGENPHDPLRDAIREDLKRQGQKSRTAGAGGGEGMHSFELNGEFDLDRLTAAIRDFLAAEGRGIIGG